MSRKVNARGIGVILPALAALLTAAIGPAAGQEISREKAAAMMLDGARRAYNEKRYDLAARQFQEYIKAYESSGSSAVRSAEYGLALCLLESPERDYKAIEGLLRKCAGYVGSDDRPFAAYYWGVALRGLGEQAAAQGPAKLAEAAQRFGEAAQQFSAAADAFTASIKPPPTTTAPAVSDEAEWAARARCDQCDMMLRTDKFPEAEAVAKAVLDHKVLRKSRCRDLALYQLGYACFAQKKYLDAGRALSKLAPFEQEFGPHAQYLLARGHHLSDERPEAAALYEAIPAAYEARKKLAADLLRAGKPLGPERKAQLESLVRDPAPTYVTRSIFYRAELLAEQGKYDDAMKGFSTLAQQHAKSPLAPEAQLRMAYCLMQTNKPAEAIKVLQPLTGNEQLGDKATWWLARAQVQGADPKNAQAYKAALTAAANTMRQAADAAAQKAAKDPAAKLRRGDILIELADTQQLLGQYTDAAATYKRVIDEKSSPDRVEEAMQRQATALHLAGMYKESEQICRRFQESYPRSTLMPAILFRRAENAFFEAAAAAEDANLKGEARQRRLKQLYDEAIRRYRDVMDQAPGFTYANQARYGMASIYYRQERFEDAIGVLGKVPDFDRKDDLAGSSYLLADCLLRTLPPESDDALGTARLVARIDKASKLLESFLGAVPTDPKAPAALLKLAYCHRRIAAVVTDDNERRNILTRAIAACDRLQKDFPKDSLVPEALFERAKCQLWVRGADTAINELRRFQGDPLASSRVAPLAMARLAGLLRAYNRAKEAVGMLEKFRQKYEAQLLADPERSGWAATLQYEYALAIRASARPDDPDGPAKAREMLEAIIEKFPNRPEAVNAVWRASQCRRQEVKALIDAVARNGVYAGKQHKLPEVTARLDTAMVALRDGLGAIGAAVLNEGKRDPHSEAYRRLLYEAAWCYRVLAEGEIDSARRKIQAEALAKATAALAERTPAGQTPPELAPPTVPLSQVPVQAAEVNAHRQYAKLIAAAPASSLAIRCRFELAEMYMQRPDEPDCVAAAVKLLADGIADTTDRQVAEAMRLRLASCLLAQDRPEEALKQVEAIGKKPASYQTACVAQYLAAEALIRQEEWAKAVQRLEALRNDRNFRNMSDRQRALVRLGQAYAQAKQWEASRKALEPVTAERYGHWQAEAFYGIGWAYQNEKQYDNAVKAYGEAIRRTVGEAAAKAQFGIGQCLLAQKKLTEAADQLLLVPLTYDYPEWSAAARCEAARAYELMEKPVEASKLYRQAIGDDADGPWAKIARQRLEQLK